jgi:hypothetical protein
MTPEEAFKFGFLARCVEMRLPNDEIQKRAEKLASVRKVGFATLTLPDPVESGKNALLYGGAAAVAVPALAYGGGRMLGHVAAGAGQPDSGEYIEQAKTDELHDEYDRRIRQLQKLRAARGLTADRKSSGRRVGF